MKDYTIAANHHPPFEVLWNCCRDNRIAHSSNVELKLVTVSVHGAAALYELGLQITPNDQVLQVTLEIPVSVAHEEIRSPDLRAEECICFLAVVRALSNLMKSKLLLALTFIMSLAPFAYAPPIETVPEPSTFAAGAILLGIAAVAVLRRRRK